MPKIMLPQSIKASVPHLHVNTPQTSAPKVEEISFLQFFVLHKRF